eukprot:1190104-Prorocentrum_minimum.AAC.1
MAAAAGQPAAVAALIECGAAPDHENGAHRTALVLAAIHGKLDSLAALVTCGATVDHTTAEVRARLAWAQNPEWAQNPNTWAQNP